MRADKIHRWLLAPAVLLLLFAPFASGAQAQQTQDAAPSRPNGHYLESLLKEPNAEASCPPGIDPLYQANVIVTGTDMRQRPWGFAQTLRSVLVKSSGDPRLKDDPRTVELAAHADDFVFCFSYADMMAGIPLKDDQGTYDRPHKLTVTFIPARIDAILAQFGDKPWHGERPVIVPALLVHGPKPPAYLLSAETPRGAEQRGAFATWASELDMNVRIPNDAELAGWGFTADRLPADLPPSPNNDVIAAGTLDWSESLPGWVGQWRCRWHGVDHAWGISGVSYDAAFRNIIGGVTQFASGNGSPD
jgi:uncharacterized protein